MRKTIGIVAFLMLIGLVLCLAGCGGSDASTGRSLTGLITIDGSSTVFPITEAVAEEFQGKYPKARITVGVSGTGGGMKKFGKGEIDITGASRPIKLKEIELCKKNGIEFIELPVAYDGIAVVVNKDNNWCKSMTIQELKLLWAPEAQKTITKWSQIRSGWPDKKINLFGPGADSGTYDYFTKSIVGKEHSSRGDYTAGVDPNVLVVGISNNKYALGFFGLAYYLENKDKLNLVGIDDEKSDNGNGPIKPALDTILDGTYQPLSRPIFIYVNTKSAAKLEVKTFVEFYLAECSSLAKEVGYVPLGKSIYDLTKKRFNKKTMGSMFQGGGSKVGVSLETLLSEGEG